MKSLARSDISESNAELVGECLKGNQNAWSTLIDKYKNLIFSIPVKNGFSADEADEIFQDVCLSLLMDLPRLRNPQALAAWLIQATSHRCFHFKRRQDRMVPVDPSEHQFVDPAKNGNDILHDVEREQIVRESVSEMPARCQELIRMLFFEEPSLQYDEVAKKLGVAKGSIGFFRMRCLDGLLRVLEEKGFR